MAKNFWDTDPETMVRSMRLEEHLRQQLIILMNQWTTRVEGHMRRNARWKNRTGALRQTLRAWTEQDETVIRLSWDYQLWYGWYLEFRTDFNGKYAIVHPTHDALAPKILNDVRRLVKSL